VVAGAEGIVFMVAADGRDKKERVIRSLGDKVPLFLSLSLPAGKASRNQMNRARPVICSTRREFLFPIHQTLSILVEQPEIRVVGKEHILRLSLFHLFN
jgi:hypothetical protein